MANSDTQLTIDQFITYRILALTSSLNRQAIQILDAACGLRLPEWRCMAIIGRSGELSLHSVSDVIGMDPGLVSRSIKSLVKQGLVITERDGNDGRVVRARLTDEGSKMFENTFPVMQRRQQRLLQSLSPEDREAFYRIMDCLKSSLDEWETEWKSNEAG